MRLIGINARLHAGKDTTFGFIEKLAESQFELASRRAFADPLKVSGLRAFGYDLDTDESVRLANKIKETGRLTITWDDEVLGVQATTITGRQFWQYYGTEAHRENDLGDSFGSDFWVDNLLPLGENGTRPNFWNNFKEDWAGYADYAVVTDVRFPNEAQRILDLGGDIWLIDAEQRLGPNTETHASEQPLDAKYITHVLDNNSSVDHLEKQVLDILDEGVPDADD